MKTTIEQAKKQGNSSRNQRIKQEFVNKHVYACITQMAEYILSKSNEDNDATFSYDDIENYFILPEWTGQVMNRKLFFEGGTDTNRDAFLAELNSMIEESETMLSNGEISEEEHEKNVSTLEDFEQEVNNLESEPQEIYEFWLVSSFLAEKLTEKGSPIIQDQDIWGRTTTGQAILLDYVITEICAEMGILEGQPNEWK